MPQRPTTMPPLSVSPWSPRSGCCWRPCWHGASRRAGSFSRLAGYTITNFSMPQPHARTVLTLTLDHAVPPDRGLRILTAAVLDGQQGHVMPDAPPPRALIGAITPHGIEYMVECFPTFAARLV